MIKDLTWEAALEFMRAVGFSIEYDGGNVAVFCCDGAGDQYKAVVTGPTPRGWFIWDTDSHRGQHTNFIGAFDDFLYQSMNDLVFGSSAAIDSVKKRRDVLHAEAHHARLGEVCAFFLKEIGERANLNEDELVFLVGGENNDDIRITAPWPLRPSWTVHLRIMPVFQVGNTLHEAWEKAKASVRQETERRDSLLKSMGYVR